MAKGRIAQKALRKKSALKKAIMRAGSRLQIKSKPSDKFGRWLKEDIIRFRKYVPLSETNPHIRYFFSTAERDSEILRNKKLPLKLRELVTAHSQSVMAGFTTGSIVPVKIKGRMAYYAFVSPFSPISVPEETSHCMLMEMINQRHRIKDPLEHYNRFTDFHEGIAQAMALSMLDLESKERAGKVMQILRDAVNNRDMHQIKVSHQEREQQSGKRSHVSREELAIAIIGLAPTFEGRIRIIKDLVRKGLFNSRNAFMYAIEKYYNKEGRK